MGARPDQRGDGDIVALAELEHQRRRNAERVGDQLDRVAEGDFEQLRRAVFVHIVAEALARLRRGLEPRGIDIELARSEEHTSELQSLMRISYAVFCLKKKKK